MRHYATQNACHELLAKSSIMWAPADFAQLPFGQHRDQSERRSHDRPSDHVLEYDVLQRRLPPYIGCERWMGRDEGRVGVGESDERLGEPVQRQGSPGDEKSHRADENGLLPTAHCPGQSKGFPGSGIIRNRHSMRTGGNNAQFPEVCHPGAERASAVLSAKVHRGWIPASFTIASASAVQSLPVKRTRASEAALAWSLLTLKCPLINRHKPNCTPIPTNPSARVSAMSRSIAWVRACTRSAASASHPNSSAMDWQGNLLQAWIVQVVEELRPRVFQARP